LIIFPPIIAILGLYLFGLENSQWSDFSPTVSFLGFFGLLIWIIYEIHTIRKTGRELNAIIDDFENFLLDSQKRLDEMSEYIPDIIDIINPFSKIKGKEPDTYMDLLMLLVEMRRYTRSTSKWLRKKSPYFVNENIFPFMGSVGKSITQSIQYLRGIPQSFVENTVANVSDILTEEINKKLAKLFPVTQASISEATKTILKSAAPTIWLCLLILIHDYLL
jgi:hypothetical protein